MTFELHPAKIEDVPTLVTVFDEAFADDEIVSYLFKDVPEHIRRERDEKWFSTFLQNLDRNGVQFTKVIDTSNGVIAGFAKWDTPIILTAEQRAERELGVKKTEPWPDGANVPLLEDFFGQLDRGKRKWIDPEKDTYLQLLAVRPKYHRLGLGSKLIKAGLEIASRRKSNVYIVASPVGLPLYVRHGWKKVDAVVVDMNKYGGSNVVVEEFLVKDFESSS